MRRIRPAQMAACLAAVFVMTGCAQAGQLNTKAQSTQDADVESVVRSQGAHEASSQELAADGAVTVTGGKLQGTEEDGIYRFLGVPYAEATARFTPASEVTPWDGVLEADSYGAISPQQGILGMGGSDAGAGTDNNCQNLNIWTPGLDDGGKRPVMVWLHGGGFSTGSANESEYDGEDLSREGDVVVVGVNARLNVFGFFDLAAYGDQYQYSANVGILDIQQALEWIQDNIEAFGGDPDNVTIFGQSGGGAKVLALMTSPTRRGSSRRASSRAALPRVWVCTLRRKRSARRSPRGPCRSSESRKVTSTRFRLWTRMTCLMLPVRRCRMSRKKRRSRPPSEAGMSLPLNRS